MVCMLFHFYRNEIPSAAMFSTQQRRTQPKFWKRTFHRWLEQCSLRFDNLCCFNCLQSRAGLEPATTALRDQEWPYAGVLSRDFSVHYGNSVSVELLLYPPSWAQVRAQQVKNAPVCHRQLLAFAYQVAALRRKKHPSFRPVEVRGGVESSAKDLSPLLVLFVEWRE